MEKQDMLLLAGADHHSWARKLGGKNPRREKLREVRKGLKAVHFDKECTEVKRSSYRLFRTKMKRLLRAEKYELLGKHRRTGGWITW
ncbi:hypothetical protein ACFQZE_14270 [Paenibacillus sp. GCM10027627]|uniref:hypothetical protein n=1 Tax=unclassified Paenibacillus TaxID=185978 RepID=UPI003640CC2B